MLEYRVVEKHELEPHANWSPDQTFAGGYVLQPGEVFLDGVIEPDIVASLFQRGVIERADGVSWDADPDAPDPDADVEPDEGEGPE